MLNPSVSVAVRCCPYLSNDGPGIAMRKSSDNESEVSIIEGDFSIKKFSVSYGWWSALTVLDESQSADNNSVFINQTDVYNDVGRAIIEDIMSSKNVVLLSFGTCGSGKTYTLFGPPGNESSSAWCTYTNPDPCWVRLLIFFFLVKSKFIVSIRAYSLD